jgi:uncharacterized Zn finger protein
MKIHFKAIISVLYNSEPTIERNQSKLKMMEKKSFSLNEGMIQEWCSSNTFFKGEHYIENVNHLTLLGDHLHATVQGSSFTPYQVKVILKDQEWKKGHCSCPSDIYPCKHLIAVLLKFVRQGAEVSEPSLQEKIRSLDISTLRSIILRLLEQHPHLLEDFQIYLMNSEAVEGKTPVVNTQAIIRKMKDLLRVDFDDYWDDEGDFLDQINSQITDLIKQASPFLEKEDGSNALNILKTVTEPLIEKAEMFTDFGGEDLLETLEAFWMEAILVSHFSQKEKSIWIERFHNWNEELDGAFTAALTLIETGWNYPLLKAVIDNQSDFDDENIEDEVFDKIAKVAFKVLKRQKKFESCLLLAHLALMDEEYASLLIELKRYSEAEQFIKNNIQEPEKLLELSQQFYENQEPQLALKIALFYRDFKDRQAKDLIRWIRNLAFELGQTEVGIKAGTDLLTIDPSFEDYKVLEKKSQKQWELIKPNLLKLIQNDKSYYQTESIRILLYENRIDDAIRLAEQSGSVPEFLIETASIQRPVWALKQCQNLASNTIQRGSSYYDQAAAWLDKAYFAAERAQLIDQWIHHMQHLLKEHQRKYHLVPKLKELFIKHKIKL